MMDLTLRRRFFAEEIQAVANLTTPALVEALASVPREAFLPPGPWLVQSEADLGGGPRRTPDGDPRHVCHNLSVAIDASRMLFNGGPGLVCMAIDALELPRGATLLHIGCGLGYYTALMAHAVGPGGRVVAIEVDEGLARKARTNLSPYPGVDVRQGDASAPLGESFDAILVNAGVTHPQPYWLDDLSPGGRLVLPLTCTFGPSAPIGKGFMVALARTAAPEVLDARVVTMVSICSATGLRDPAANDRLGAALRRAMRPSFTRLRRDAHDSSAACWLHGESWCLSA